MIILSEVAQKLENILNGVDSEVGTSGSVVIATNPTIYYFQVETEGFHIDHIVAPSKDKNFIPVFVSSMGGQFNPVKGLKQGTYSLPIDIYFPVRFKNDFFALGDFLVDAFVGTKLNYGEISGKAISNISAPQFGEIQMLQFQEFQDWINAKFTKPSLIKEPYLSMHIVLYLTNAAPGFVYGNDVSCELKFTYGEDSYTLKDVNFDGASIQSNSQPQSEQEEGTNESVSLPFSTAYGTSFKVYPNVEKEAYESTLEEPIYFYKELLKVWFAGNIQTADFELKYTIAGDSDLTFTRKCFVSSIVAPINKGELFSLTMSFAKKVEIEA